MRLQTLYPNLTKREREALAAACGITPGYLWQIATRWKPSEKRAPKQPSIQLITKLATADARLHITDMVAEFSESAPKAPA